MLIMNDEMWNVETFDDGSIVESDTGVVIVPPYGIDIAEEN